MLDIKYQATLFVNLKDIPPTPENVMTIMSLYIDQELQFIPGTSLEISRNNPTPIPRMNLIDRNNGWTINFGSNRIDIIKNSVDENGVGTIEDFTNKACSLFKLFFEKFNKKVHRISLVSSALFKDMDLKKINSIYNKFSNPINFYKENEAEEWLVHSVARVKYEISNLNELVNISTDISRKLVDSSNQIINAIILDFDINTNGENEDVRFENLHFHEFYKKALNSRNIIVDDIKSYIYE